MEKLDCKSLMIGDWVCYSKSNNYCTKVNEIKCTHDVPDDMLYYIKGQRDNRDRLKNEFDETFIVDILSPIPLTAEILEKNGFVLDDEWYISTGQGVNIDVAFRDDNKFVYDLSILTGSGSMDIHAKYVHELQHALRLCGITHEIIL